MQPQGVFFEERYFLIVVYFYGRGCYYFYWLEMRERNVSILKIIEGRKLWKSNIMTSA